MQTNHRPFKGPLVSLSVSTVLFSREWHRSELPFPLRFSVLVGCPSSFLLPVECWMEARIPHVFLLILHSWGMPWTSLDWISTSCYFWQELGGKLKATPQCPQHVQPSTYSRGAQSSPSGHSLSISSIQILHRLPYPYILLWLYIVCPFHNTFNTLAQ